MVASCFFYGYFKVEYLLILFFTIIIDYFAGIWIEKKEGFQRKLALIVSIVANVGVLAYFKYYNFIFESFNSVLHRAGSAQQFDLLTIILPIGLSFHTFQAMSYTIEVYRGVHPAERHLGIYALYVMFYPQLVAGPIERPQNVIPQFYEVHKFEYQRVVSGLRLMLWGMFKKVVIADRLSLFVDLVYNEPTHYKGLPLAVATLFFAFQIFCDFSGYSDIALGSARVMGFDLMKNFDRPYFAKSIAEFWKRWHISLSTWFRDYLYIPLGGNRKGGFRTNLNLFIVFMVSGLWHGASWNYVIWGALHGVYLVVGRETKSLQIKLFGDSTRSLLAKITNAIFTFGLVYFAWIFFRARTLRESYYIISNFFQKSSHTLHETIQLIGINELWILLISFLIMEGVHVYQRKNDIVAWFANQRKWVQWGVYYTLILLIICFGVYTQTQFIYFQF